MWKVIKRFLRRNKPIVYEVLRTPERLPVVFTYPKEPWEPKILPIIAPEVDELAIRKQAFKEWQQNHNKLMELYNRVA